MGPSWELRDPAPGKFPKNFFFWDWEWTSPNFPRDREGSLRGVSEQPGVRAEEAPSPIHVHLLIAQRTRRLRSSV